MTHTAGFEDNGIHQTVDSEGDLYPFRGYCAENLPARVYPPGTVTSYSNYGTTLAAVIVEDVSGVPYEQYVRSRILAPLAMNLTTVPETLPPDAAARLSKGYTLTGRENLPLPDSIYVIGPAGTIMSTAPDMAKFMLAGLGNGTYGNATILPERAAALMHARAFANDPRVSGMCLGFYEQYYNGLRTTGHGGDTEEFHSQLVLIPDKQAGYFVSYNSRGGGAARDELFEDFMDHYYPAESPVLPEPGPANVSRLQQYAGTYESNRHSYTRFEKYVNPNSRQEITVTPNGTLMTGSREYVETGPGVFSRLDGTRPALGDLVFHAAPDGTIEYYCLVNLPVFVFDRVPWYATQGFTDGLKTAAGILLATVFLWPLLFAFRRSHGIPEPASLTAGAAALVLTAFVFVVLPAVVADESLMQSYFHERTVPALLTAVLSIPVIAAVLTAATVALAAFAWKQKFWTLPHRIQYTVVAVALVAMLWWVNFWNLWVWCL
jgi:hypothetical protein